MPIWSSEINELERLYDSFKKQLPELEKELVKLLKEDDENIILLYSRRCLEVIITDLCESELKRERGTEPLKGIIDKLNKEKKVPFNIITSMDHLNGMAAYGAHPKDFDPEQVKPVLINLNIIIKWYLKYKGKEFNEPKEKEIKVRQEPTDEAIYKARPERKGKHVILVRHKLLSAIMIVSVLVIAAILTYPKIFQSNTLEKLRASGERISVAVMPFQNMTNDTTFNVWQDGIQDNLINTLANSEELKVRQTESVSVFLNGKGITNLASIKPSLIRSISRNLDVDVLISGSVNTAGEELRINSQIIDSKSNEAFKSFQIDGSPNKILNLIDSLSQMIRDFLIISKIEKESPMDFQAQNLLSTNSPEAVRYFIYGQKAFLQRDNKTAIAMFSRALDIDSNYTAAAIMLPFAYRNQGMVTEAKKLCLKIYKKRDQVGIVFKVYLDWLYSVYFETPRESIKYLQQLHDLDDKAPFFNDGMCIYYNRLHQYERSFPAGEKSLEIYRQWGINPSSVWSYTNLGLAYHQTGQYTKEKQLYKSAEKLFPDNIELLSRMAILYLSTGDSIVAKSYIEKYIKICRENLTPEITLKWSLGSIYSEAGKMERAEKYYQQALSLDPTNSYSIYLLSYFLIDNEIDINRGLVMAEKGLESHPDNYLLLDTKGWGFYKLGKYREALALLEQSDSLKQVYNYDIEFHLESAKKAVSE